MQHVSYASARQFADFSLSPLPKYLALAASAAALVFAFGSGSFIALLLVGGMALALADRLDRLKGKDRRVTGVSPGRRCWDGGTLIGDAAPTSSSDLRRSAPDGGSLELNRFWTRC